MDERSKNTIDDWKRYLHSKSQRIAVDSERGFRRAMRGLDDLIAASVPSTKGMIWRNGQINPNVSIADVDVALTLLSKFGQANLDDLGNPSDPNRLSGTPMNSMFISQEDSKSDEWSPGNSQNQGTEGSSIPRKIPSSGKKDSSKTPEKQPKTINIDERMKRLTNLIENVEK
jgi:hypothetical protein